MPKSQGDPTGRAMRRYNSFADLEGCDAYEILDVTEDASFDEIKRRYHELIKQVHPDRGGDQKCAELVNYAFEVLSRRRLEYDRLRMMTGRSKTKNSGSEVRTDETAYADEWEDSYSPEGCFDTTQTATHFQDDEWDESAEAGVWPSAGREQPVGEDTSAQSPYNQSQYNQRYKDYAPQNDSAPVSALVDPLSRLLARIIDSAILAVPVIATILIGGSMAHWKTDNNAAHMSVLVISATIFGYEWLSLVHHGQTIGKKIMRIRVVSYAGRQLVDRQASCRAFVVFLVFCLILMESVVGYLYCLINVLLLLWHQWCLHDKIAKTKVIRA